MSIKELTDFSKSARKDEEEYVVNKYLARALASMSQMDWNVGQSGHCEILEGMLYFVLDHTGRLVSNAVFDEHVAKSDRPGNITQNGPPPLVEAVKLETRYIVQILYAALGTSSARKELIARVLADRSLNTSAQLRSIESSNTTQDILNKARKTIQSSLLKSAVGGDELEGLKTPVSVDIESVVSVELHGHGEKYGVEWLLGSVWALVGWEMVAR